MPKARCQVCHRWVAVRKGGRLREHRPSITDTRVCGGSADVAVEYFDAPMFEGLG